MSRVSESMQEREFAASYGIGDDVAETVAFDGADRAFAVFAFDLLVS